MSGQNKCGNLVVVEDRFIHLDYCNECEKCRFFDSQQLEDLYLDDMSINVDDNNIGMDIDLSIGLDDDEDEDMDTEFDDIFNDIFNLSIDDEYGNE